VITEPLTAAQLATIGWRKRQGLEDARNLVHYFRLTADNRLAMGGSDVSIVYGRDMDRDHNSRVFNDLERDVVRLFPGLKGVGFTHRWGGPVSVTLDMTPALGYLGDRRTVYSLGCIGHGVSMAHLNGRALADLLGERDTDLTRVWFVNRRTLPWPPEPLRFLASHTLRAYLRLEDWYYER
jgi:glycine/D-amino acid oxidase-like deaminating enzyme